MKSIALFLALICLNVSLHAEVLKFKCGDSAKCRIHEEYENENEFCGRKSEKQSEHTIEIAIKILGVDENDHPILVELTPLNIDFSMVEKEDGKVTFKKYNSMDAFFAVSEFEPFNNLLNKPLVFFVKNDQSTVEATGVLDKFEEDTHFDYIFGFEGIATRLLHLAGEELPVASSHTIKSDSDNDCVYTIHREDSGLIEASWNGDFTEVDEDGFIQNSVDGSVVWNVTHPLNQKRELHSRNYVKFSDHWIRMSQHQTWEPIE